MLTKEQWITQYCESNVSEITDQEELNRINQAIEEAYQTYVVENS